LIFFFLLPNSSFWTSTWDFFNPTIKFIFLNFNSMFFFLLPNSSFWTSTWDFFLSYYRIHLVSCTPSNLLVNQRIYTPNFMDFSNIHNASWVLRLGLLLMTWI
jgi:hypothetical protein